MEISSEVASITDLLHILKKIWNTEVFCVKGNSVKSIEGAAHEEAGAWKLSEHENIPSGYL